jgi:hypothetical protein
MKWKYYIPHQWTQPRTVWEDIWLLPANPGYAGQSIWLTIDALGDMIHPESDRAEFQEKALAKLGDKDFWIEAADMIVRAEDFDKEEFLGWVHIWLKETGFEVAELIECPITDFTGTNNHAITIEDQVNREGP